MTQQNFNYNSFFNTLEKRQENKNKVNFWNKAKTETTDLSDYETINGQLCFTP